MLQPRIKADSIEPLDRSVLFGPRWLTSLFRPLYSGSFRLAQIRPNRLLQGIKRPLFDEVVGDGGNSCKLSTSWVSRKPPADVASSCLGARPPGISSASAPCTSP